MSIDTHPDQKEYHMAIDFRGDGAVSALCFKKRRAINLNAASWTVDETAVTCRKCLKILRGEQ